MFCLPVFNISDGLLCAHKPQEVNNPFVSPREKARLSFTMPFASSQQDGNRLVSSSKALEKALSLTDA